jgi:hypothetical protein
VSQTRVDLRHLLEDIRDSYPCPVEEAILTELIANSLDSGCSRIDVTIHPEQRRLTLVDNGESMTPKRFERYHDIASTAKVRGRGIGFAGVGAKLALLVCREVLTEARRSGRVCASRWWLETDHQAPWEETAPLGLVAGPKGTGIRLNLKPGAAARTLLSDRSVADTIRTSFHPLLDPEFAKVLSHIYPEGVSITVNGEAVAPPQIPRKATQYFLVRRGKRGKLLGIGFLIRASRQLPESQRGLAISTFGKVIKRGWEWLGISPRNPAMITGIVEVPELAQCLTTNKSDFMRDPVSLQKYYKYRKAIQDVVLDVLEGLGERQESELKPDRSLKRLQKEIVGVVAEILPDFPELAPLFGRRAGLKGAGVLLDSEGNLLTDGGESRKPEQKEGEKSGGPEKQPGSLPEGSVDRNSMGDGQIPDRAGERETIRRRRPGLMIGFDDETGGDEIAWLRGSTIYINSMHPAYRRIRGTGAANIYVTFAVAVTLSTHVRDNRDPLDLLQVFLATWGRSG